MLGNYVPGGGNPNAKIMFVGEAPGKDEDELRKPFMGASGMILRSAIRNAGLSPEQCWITNVLKYRPPQNKFELAKEIGIDVDQEIENLWKEIEQINPNIIVAVGNEALRVLTGRDGILSWRGSIIPSRRGNWKVIAIVHPAFLLHDEGGEHGAGNNWVRSIIDFDVKRAAEEAITQRLDLPYRNLSVATTVESLPNFLAAFERGSAILGGIDSDIEVIKAIPVCIGIAFDKTNAISVPLFREICGVHLTDMPLWALAENWRLLDELFRRYPVFGQNYKFDQLKKARLGFRFPLFGGDTAHMAHTVDPELPKNQGFLTSIYTREPYYKDEGKEFRPGKDDVRQLFLYNAKDCAVNVEIKQELDDTLHSRGLYRFYYDFVRYLHGLYCEIETNGVRANLEVREELYHKYKERWDKQQGELNRLCGMEVNVASPPQVARIVYQQLRLPMRMERGKKGPGTGEEILVGLMANHCEKKEDARQILELILEVRQIRKTLGTYILAEPDYDGRWRTSYNISGTESGRTSTKIYKPPVRAEKHCHAFQTLTKHGEVGADIRKMYIPDGPSKKYPDDPSLVFMNFDQSQAEGRVVALLSDDFDMLVKYDTVDVHCETACIVCELGLEYYPILMERKAQLKLVGEEPPERFLGKTCRHAGNYDMGKRRAMLTINTDAKKYGIPVRVSEWKANKMLEAFHAMNPKIREVFHKRIQDLVSNDRLLRSPEIIPGIGGRERKFYGRYGEQLFKEAYAQIPQSTVADKTKLVMLQVREELQGIQILGEAHDAFFVQVHKRDADLVYKTVMKYGNQPIDFSKCSIPCGNLVIPWDCEMGETNYKELRKYKPAA